jgi:hypothetical protein
MDGSVVGFPDGTAFQPCEIENFEAVVLDGHSHGTGIASSAKEHIIKGFSARDPSRSITSRCPPPMGGNVDAWVFQLYPPSVDVAMPMELSIGKLRPIASMWPLVLSCTIDA